MNRILITGGAGFIAHHIIKEILDTTDWEIVSLDKLDFSGNLNRLADILSKSSEKHRVKVVHHDLRAEINKTTRGLIGDINYVLHMSANPHVDKSILDPLSSVLDNVVGTCNILNFARELPNLKRFIYFSTDEVFGTATDEVQFDEYSRYNSGNPYSASKASGEELAVAFYNTYKMPIYITHSMNVFGERQQAKAFIPICINKILNGETLTIHSDETLTQIPSRKYVYAKDVADAVMILLNTNIDYIEHEGLKKVPKFNIVGIENLSILDIAQTIAATIGKELNYKLTSSDRPGADIKYSMSNSHMYKLGWEAKVPFNTAIPGVVEWFLKNKEWLTP
jgi:dTDP-glucose 4,6-dehydratase